ncbi:MAG: hypothetical protein U1E27_07050 [Kiritimatiellia bacterium]|nr:hypothetical protein [Kiritimatiellia bacterium]
MNCRLAKKIAVEASGDDFSESVKRHIDQCPACRLFFEERRWMRDCLGLARLEKADSGFESRLLNSIHHSIRETDRKKSRPRRIDWPGWAMPAWRWAAAACLVASLGILTARKNPFAAGPEQPAQPAQAAAPILNVQTFMPTVALPDPSPPSPPLAAVGTPWMDQTNRPGPENLRFIRFEP